MHHIFRWGEKGQVNAATQEISLKKSAVSDNKSVKIVNKKKILYTDTWISLGVKLNEKKSKIKSAYMGI